MTRNRWLLLPLLVMAGGCYVYDPVRPSDVVMDARVRATVSAAKAQELAPAFRGASSAFTGTVLERDGEGLLLEVPVYGVNSGMSATALRNRVYVPFEELVSLEGRSLSRWRTGAVIGALVAGVTTTWVLSGGADRIDDKPKTGTDNAVIVRIPLGIF